MSIKEKRKTRRDYSIYSDCSEMDLRSFTPNLYKMPNEREILNERLFRLGGSSGGFRKEIRIKGINNRLSKEIALTS